MWFNPNLAYVHGERTWESFINKLGIRNLTFLLISQEYAFSLNLHLDNKSIPSLFALSPFALLLSFLFLSCCDTIFYAIIFIYRVLQSKPYSNYEMILVVGCLKNLINHCISWFFLSRIILDLQTLETNLHWIEIEFYLEFTRKDN